MIEIGDIAYFGKLKGSYTPLKPAYNFTKTWDNVAMLWGDPVYVFEINGSVAKVSTKGHVIEINLSDLMETPLLSIYQIDVGQGDAALVHTPDNKWLMIDGGPSPQDSNSGKSAANFIYWKMFTDQSWIREFTDWEKPLFEFDAWICTHPDSDHFAGFEPLIANVESGYLRIQTIYHNGIGRFRSKSGFTKYQNGAGFSQLGPVNGQNLPDAFITTLIDTFDDVRNYDDVTSTRDWKLKGEYRDWLANLEKCEGQGIGALRRLSTNDVYLPNYEPSPGKLAIRVLGPYEESYNGSPALRYLDTAGKNAMGDPSITRNGHSIILRFDYGEARILFTGDLNFNSQALLLSNLPGSEFQAHVVKACHHGSEDISLRFLKAINPWATMISSGDAEGHVHPRALMLGLTGASSDVRKHGPKKKFMDFEEPSYFTPLLYSTELSRSVRLREPHRVLDKQLKPVEKAKLQARKANGKIGGLTMELQEWLLADELTYGMINVRTDGKRVCLAVQNEGKKTFHVEYFDL